MRLGEIKKILDDVVDENNVIIIDQEQIYGGQAYLVNNFQEIKEVFGVINSLDWNDANDEQILLIMEKYHNSGNQAQLDQGEFGVLNSYISEVNKKLPFFYSILETMTEEQDDKVINIKLPEENRSFKELNELNARYEKILQCFNVDGEYMFSGFDIGTAWYIVLTQGILSSSFLIGCLNIAQEWFKTKSEYFKSKEAQISYETTKVKAQDYTMGTYQEEYFNQYLKREITELISAIKQTHGATQEELHSKLLKGTKALVKELGNGTEFHLSLNPPKYASENNGGIRIDYKKIQQIRADEDKKLGNDKPKELSVARDMDVEGSDK